MKKSILAVLCVFLLTGCAGWKHGLTTGLSAGAAGLVANKLSHGDPLITALGAGGGAVLAEGVQALVTSSQQKAYEQGRAQGRAQAAKEFYWDLQARQRNPQGQ